MTPSQPWKLNKIWLIKRKKAKINTETLSRVSVVTDLNLDRCFGLSSQCDEDCEEQEKALSSVNRIEFFCIRSLGH